MAMDFSAGNVLEHVQLNNMVLAADNNGVVSGLAVSERGAGANMSVDVATGTALIANTSYTESSIVNLVIAASHATLYRKDLISYDPTTSNPIVTQGTNHAGGTADPIYPPGIPAGDILLAIVDVAAAAMEIENADITDCIVEVSDTGTIMNNPATADLAMADYGLTGLDQMQAYDSGGIHILNSAGTTIVDIATNSYAIEVFGDNIDMNGVQMKALGDPTLAQDAATKNWVENTAIIDAATLNNCNAGLSTDDVWKIPNHATGVIYQHTGTGIGGLATGTSGYQLTTRGSGLTAVWAAASDLIFSDTHCPKCGKEFQGGDDIILHVIGHNEMDDLLTIPMHLSCANAPKKRVAIKRKIMDDHYILDEATGEIVVQRVSRMREMTVTRHKLKERYAINDVTGKAYKLNQDGIPQTTEQTITDSIEEVEEIISEQEYEEVEYML